MIGSYPKVHHVSKRHAEKLFDDPVVVQEKVDGSQFSFGVFNGELHCRSKNTVQNIHSPDSLFRPVVEYLKSVMDDIPEGYTFRGETLKSPKHNVLHYDTVPDGHFALFDVIDRFGDFCVDVDELDNFASRLGVSVVPTLFSGRTSLDHVKELLAEEPESFLGGVIVEGVVVKNYHTPSPYDPIIVAKIVREEFQEKHDNQRGKKQVSGKSIVEQLVATYNNEARWRKAVQHLREQDLLAGEPQDIALLIPEIREDIVNEELDDIKDVLWNHFKGDFLRGVIRGAPEWYLSLLEEGVDGE